MSLEAFFKGMAICARIAAARRFTGVSEICPSNASYLVRFDPDVIAPDDDAGNLEGDRGAGRRRRPRICRRASLKCRCSTTIPGRNETRKRFRERHQDPKQHRSLNTPPASTVISSIDEFVAAHSGAPWFVSMVGFVAGLPWLYQIVERSKQIEAPKYLRPRTDTPKLTIGHGGCFAAIYSVRGAGGYQMFGITPAPIYDPAQISALFQGLFGVFPAR